MANYVLEILDGDRAGEVLPVTDRMLRIGRKPGNDIVLADEKTSGVHCEIAPEGDRLVPIYDQMTQFGVDVQYTAEAWLWKLEAIARDTRVDSFMAAVGGFEYTFYGVKDSSADVGVLLEYLYDGRNGVSPPTAADNDLFVGTRLALNDADDTSVLAGVAVDLDTHELFLNIEAERRFGDSLSVELQLRSFMNAEPADALFTVEQDDYLQLRLSWYY